MKNLTNFQGENIKFVRELHGLTSSKLGEMLGVSQQYVSQWENGKAVPTLEVFEKLETIFKFPKQYYFQSHENESLDTPVFFRRKTAVSKKDVEKVRKQLQYFAEVEQVVSRKLGLPYLKISDLILAKPFDVFEITDFDDIDLLVEKVKNRLSIGDGPLKNVTKIVEKLGIRVLSLDFKVSGVDAITFKFNGEFYIGVNTNGISNVRVRFNLLHELGHILLHSNFSSTVIQHNQNHKRIEGEANRFASSFLISSENFGYEMLTGTTLNNFLRLRTKWNISIAALIYRAHQEGYISDSSNIYLIQEMSRKGWRREEPGDSTEAIEKPDYMASALKYFNVNLDYFDRDFRTKGLWLSEELKNTFEWTSPKNLMQLFN